MMIAMGNLVRDPELRYTPKGTAVLEGSVALNRKWTTEDGEKKEEVTFLPFAAFGRMAETIAEYFQKGALIHLTGYMKQETWDDKNTGEKKSKLKLIVNAFSFCGSTGKTSDDDAPRTQRKAARPVPQAASEPEISDDDVPF